MTTPYTKTNFGNKQFVIQWDLELSGPSEIAGDIFEAVDCELVSIHATTIGSGASLYLSYTNKSSGGLAINLTSPSNNQIISPPFPPVRFYAPTLGDAAATASVALLFREL